MTITVKIQKSDKISKLLTRYHWLRFTSINKREKLTRGNLSRGLGITLRKKRVHTEQSSAESLNLSSC